MDNYASAVPLDLTKARATVRALSIAPEFTSRRVINLGYIAGSGDGIVTVRGKPAPREILLMDANSRDYKFVGRVWSMDNGHYIFTDLDPDKRYLIMARDYNKEYEPFAYDYVQPATDLTRAEQDALRESWTK